MSLILQHLIMLKKPAKVQLMPISLLYWYGGLPALRQAAADFVKKVQFVIQP